ncbi:hypothetical protein DR871_000075 [Flavobacterium petrolei]|uniref:DUF547 domain-containing protein n=1 Tax=Flavobacterium petrolei TaxID=2259594 RepID=A0A482TLU6_9FLAO|nr:hypothetical protein [Flavobacterium petrolei]RYJ52488.1 hypothetical protein DR871_000075 [Flavobacterium petrolei]
MRNYYIVLSEKIIVTAKIDGDSSLLRRQLFYIRAAKLEKSLDSDDLRKTFWINIYNAYYLIISKESTDNITIYNLKRIKIARS